MSITNKYAPPIVKNSMPGGFTRSARLLPDGIDWSGGITFTPSCGGADVWGCSYGVDKTNITDKADPVEFDPFMLYAGKRCSGSPDVEELSILAKSNLVIGSSSRMARELQSSDALIGNPDLITTATDITPVTAPCIDNAIAGLISAAGACGGMELTFHAPFVALAPLMDKSLVVFEDGKYRLGGHTIIVDDYDAHLEPTSYIGTAATDTQAFIYATGPVEYKLGQEIDVVHYTHRTNESVVLAEQMAIIRFDTCCVYSILAELC